MLRIKSGAGFAPRFSERIVALARLAADAGKTSSRRFVLRAQIDGAGVGAGGLGLVAETLIGKAPGYPDLRVLRIGLHRLVKIGGRLFGLVQSEVAERAAEQRLGLPRPQTTRCGKIVDRELVLLLALIEQAAIVIRLSVIGTKADRLVEILKRFPRLVPRLVDHAAAKPGRRVIGIEHQRPLVI